MCGTNTCIKQLEHALTFWVGALRDQSYQWGQGASLVSITENG